MLSQLAQELQTFAPFAQMALADVQALIAACRQSYFASGEAVLSPADGPVTALMIVRRGAITGSQG
ncbi:MAG: hypothetical protein HC858_00565 [Brachymonas sp.]|nr:hypothetical protein [Brachymonas sp.]